MRLSLVMFFGKKPYGYKYRGKHRVLKPVTPQQLLELRRDYERTEQNMLYLRHPYLTVEQSKGHTAHKKDERYCKMIEKVMKFRNEKFANHVTLADQLSHLKVKEAWD